MTTREIQEQIKKTERLLLQLKRKLYRHPEMRTNIKRERLEEIWLAPSKHFAKGLQRSIKEAKQGKTQSINSLKELL